jgi:dipeptidase E
MPRAGGRRLVFYSGGQERRNAAIHERLLELALGRARGRRSPGVHMTYLPYTHVGAAAYFSRFERRYRPFGGTCFECVAADDPALERDAGARRRAERTLLASDVVYLAGGNTFHFLHHLRRSGLLDTLKRFAARGGVLAGLSAGGVLMTPDIGLAGYPDFDRDDDEVGLSGRRLGALGLVPFEFFPHYRHSARYREALRSWSARTRRPLYACRDGSGIVIEGDRFTLHGDVWLFDRGRETRIGS